MFKIKEFVRREFVYCGRRVSQAEDFSIALSMSGYVDTLALLSIDSRRKDTPSLLCSATEVREFRGSLGALSWLATMGRPDLSYSVSRLQGYTSAPCIEHMLECNQVIREARKYRDFKLTFRALDLGSICFASVNDASFATMSNSKSQTGAFVFIGDSAFNSGAVGTVNCLAWRSSRQKRVARSTFGAEALALGDGVDLADFVRSIWYEVMGLGDLQDALLYAPTLHWVTDAKDVYDSLSKEGIPSPAERRLALDIVILKELLGRPNNFLHWCDTSHMVADGLTKSMQNDHIRQVLGSGIYSLTYSPECRQERKLPKAPIRSQKRSKVVTSLHSAVARVRFNLVPEIFSYKQDPGYLENTLLCGIEHAALFPSRRDQKKEEAV